MRTPAEHGSPGPARSKSALARYLSDIRRYPLLDRDDELVLARRDREALVLSNLRFVVKIAAGFRGRGLPMDDLINEGNLGLIQAAERFDPDRGIKFITYAAYWIRKALRHALSEQTSTVRIPRYQIVKARRRAETDPPDGEGAAGEGNRFVVTSLDEPVSSRGERTQADLLEDDAPEDPEQRAVRLDLLSKISGLLDVLDEKERTVIVRRFGLAGDEGRTLKQIGSAFGLSRERIRQIEREARVKLRENLESSPRRTSRERRTRRKRCNPFAGGGS